MPHTTDVASMLREDVVVARTAWAESARPDVDEFSRREESDFLEPANHEGEKLDFHALRHTCGAWLAMTGAHPKAVQSVMRHSSITLTLDTYGHLLPGQEADTVARFPSMMGDAGDASEMRATGTDDASAQQNAQHSTPQIALNRTTSHGGDTPRKPVRSSTRKPVPDNMLSCDSVRQEEGFCEWGRWDSNPQPTDYESAALTD